MTQTQDHRDLEVGEWTKDIVLAEYSRVVGTVNDRMGAQRTLINLNLTASAAIFGVVLSHKENSLLLLLIPFLSASLALLYTENAQRIWTACDYICGHLREIATGLTGERGLMCWDLKVVRSLEEGRGTFAVGVATPMIFLLCPGIALAWVAANLESSPLAWTVWILGIGAVVMEIAAGLKLARLHRSRLRAHRAECERMFPR